jgi:hypothetical protein
MNKIKDVSNINSNWKYYLFAIFFVFTILITIVLIIGLPGVKADGFIPDGKVTMVVDDPGLNSYFNATFSNVPSGYDITQ